MNDFSTKFRALKTRKLQQHILEDAKDFQEIIVLCLGNYEDNLTPFLTFASKIGTILKANLFPVYGDMEKPILIDKEIVAPILENITKYHPNAFVLVVMTSISNTKRKLGNIDYENSPYTIKDLKVGNAIIQLCGSFGTGKNYKENYSEYIKNGLPLSIVNETATDIALTIIKVMNKKHEITLLNKEKPITLILEKETLH